MHNVPSRPCSVKRDWYVMKIRHSSRTKSPKVLVGFCNHGALCILATVGLVHAQATLSLPTLGGKMMPSLTRSKMLRPAQTSIGNWLLCIRLKRSPSRIETIPAQLL